MKIKMPNGWRTIKSLVHKIRLHGRRGKGTAESFSREKLRRAPQKEGGWKILCYLLPVWPRLVHPLKSRMNGKKTHTHTHTPIVILIVIRSSYYYYSCNKKKTCFWLYHDVKPSRGFFVSWLRVGVMEQASGSIMTGIHALSAYYLPLTSLFC